MPIFSRVPPVPGSTGSELPLGVFVSVCGMPCVALEEPAMPLSAGASGSSLGGSGASTSRFSCEQASGAASANANPTILRRFILAMTPASDAPGVPHCSSAYACVRAHLFQIKLDPDKSDTRHDAGTRRGGTTRTHRATSHLPRTARWLTSSHTASPPRPAVRKHSRRSSPPRPPAVPGGARTDAWRRPRARRSQRDRARASGGS